MKVNRLSLLGMLLAAALIVGYIEFLFIPSIGIPGVKLGLSNITVLILLSLYNEKYAAILAITKTILSSLLFAGLDALIYGLTGMIFSLLIMIIFNKTKKFSLMGISMAGAVFHNIGQLIAAMIIVSNFALAYYSVILLIAGLITGLIIGILAQAVIPILKKVFIL